jgi:hypothetical protein
MAKIGIILTSKEFSRNYLATKAFAELAQSNEIKLLLYGDLDVQSNLDPFDSVMQIKGLKKSWVGVFIFDLFMIRFRYRSTSFKYRIARKFPNIYWQLQYLRKNKVLGYKFEAGHSEVVKSSNTNKQWLGDILRIVKKVLQILSRFCFSKCKKGFYFICGSFVLFPFVSKTLRVAFEMSAGKFEFIREFNLIIIPSSAHEPVVPLILKKARKYGVQTLLLVDNWDNLSSKSILWEKPDWLGCWGPQSVQHAVEIQDINPNQCFSIGTPRIDTYFVERKKKITSRFNYPYILFLGSSVPYAEVDFLYALDEEVSLNSEIYGGARIIYRPHPLRGGWELPSFKRLSSTILDPDLEDRVNSGQMRHNRDGYMPSLEHYPSLLQNAVCVVSGLTSMMFEASIFYKRCTILAFDEATNITSPKRILKNYVHFEGIESIPNLRIVHSYSEAIKSVRSDYNHQVDVDKNRIDSAVARFLFHDLDTYSVRLQKKVMKILKS